MIVSVFDDSGETLEFPSVLEVSGEAAPSPELTDPSLEVVIEDEDENQISTEGNVDVDPATETGG